MCQWTDCDREPVTPNARYCQRCYQRWRTLMRRIPFKFVAPHRVCAFDDCERTAPGQAAHCKAHQRQARESGGLMWSLIAQSCPWCGRQVDRSVHGQVAYCDACRQTRRAMRHGLQPGQYEQMLAQQGGVCAIPGCGAGGVLHIDHDHECCPGTYSCGACVRGLICASCNTGLGLFGDDLVRLVGATVYLQRTRAQAA